ncbi:MAG: hypothetical protein JO214_08570 [Frankiaceae bacterium]|nr:hypothetical protein [Frankiaceae bacterium]
MQPTQPLSLFEREMRDQVAAAEASVIDALATGDPILIEAARGHLDGLVDLARRNGLDLKPLINDTVTIDLAATEPEPIDILDQPAAS